MLLSLNLLLFTGFIYTKSHQKWIQQFFLFCIKYSSLSFSIPPFPTKKKKNQNCYFYTSSWLRGYYYINNLQKVSLLCRYDYSNLVIAILIIIKNNE